MNDTNKTTNRIGFLLPFFYITAPAMAVLRSVACVKDMAETGYFNEHSLITISNITLAILAIIFSTHAFSHNRNDSVPKESFCNPPTYIASALLAVGISFAIYELAISLLDEKGQIREIVSSDIIVIISAALGAASLLFLLLNAIIEAHHSQIRASLGIAASLFFSTYAVCIYFDNSTSINMQHRILNIISLTLMAVFMLYETRIPLGHSKWHSYVAFGFVAALLLSYTSIPAIVYYIVNRSVIPGTTIIQICLSLASAIYAITRISIIAFAPEDESCDLADSILDIVHLRKQKSSSHARK
jgi:hypothetical protein